MTENELMAEKERLEKLIPEYEKNIRMWMDTINLLARKKYLSKASSDEICALVGTIKYNATMLGAMKNRLISINKGYDVYDL